MENKEKAHLSILNTNFKTKKEVPARGPLCMSRLIGVLFNEYFFDERCTVFGGIPGNIRAALQMQANQEART